MRRRIFSISDLHIGGQNHPMLGHPELLTDFLSKCAQAPRVPGEELELVINGDFIDFLAESPEEAWTPTESDAKAKLEQVFRQWSSLFDAFASCVVRLDRLTILLGNHDIELAYPRVRERLFERLGTSAHRCHFVSNNECYRVGDVVFEHGNRYDTWNAIDHDSLRAIMSAVSRGEVPPIAMPVCPGSRLVHEVMNPLKAKYHFVDLLKPEDRIVLLLLTTLEPALKRDLRSIGNAIALWTKQVYRAARWKAANRDDAQPGQLELVSREQAEVGEEIAEAFADELAIDGGQQLVGIDDAFAPLFASERRRGLGAQLISDDGVDDARLRKLQLTLGAKLVGDVSFDEGDGANPYAIAASKMIGAGAARVVVMGHTHLARDIAFGGGRYVNTGTWADLMRLDPALLNDDVDSRRNLADWLRRLVSNELASARIAEPCYAEVRVGSDGHLDPSSDVFLHRHTRDTPLFG